jgi:hypothetical protein
VIIDAISRTEGPHGMIGKSGYRFSIMLKQEAKAK